jgi:PAS domain S-box-containing protein
MIESNKKTFFSMKIKLYAFLMSGVLLITFCNFIYSYQLQKLATVNELSSDALAGIQFFHENVKNGLPVSSTQLELYAKVVATAIGTTTLVPSIKYHKRILGVKVHLKDELILEHLNRPIELWKDSYRMDDVYMNSDYIYITIPFIHRGKELLRTTVIYSMDELDRRLLETVQVLFILFILFSTFCVFGIWRITLHFFKSIRVIGAGFKEVSEGNLRHKLHVESDRELNSLIDSFRAMQKTVIRFTSELKASERKFHSVFNASEDAIFLFDKEMGKVVDINCVGTRIFGFTRSDLKALRYWDIVYDQKCIDQSTYSMLLQTVADDSNIKYKCEGLHKTGSKFTIQMKLKYVTLGKREGLIAIIKKVGANYH